MLCSKLSDAFDLIAVVTGHGRMVVALLQAEANVIDEELLAQALVEEVSQPTGSSADRLVYIARWIMQLLVAANWLPHLRLTASMPYQPLWGACVPCLLATYRRRMGRTR